jgi:hypothetical protein
MVTDHLPFRRTVGGIRAAARWSPAAAGWILRWYLLQLWQQRHNKERQQEFLFWICLIFFWAFFIHLFLALFMNVARLEIVHA